jgi:tetratricopeptide (TPR) repeat protein
MKSAFDPRQPVSEVQRLMSEARTLFAQGQVERAEELLRRALELSPKNVHALTAFGAIAAETDRKDLARNQMARVLELDPKYLPALCWMSKLAMEAEQFNDAERFGQRALQLQPQNAAMHAIVGSCLARRSRYQEAISSLKTAVDLNPNAAEVLYELGDVLIEAGYEREAVGILKRALAIAPNNQGELKLAYLELGLGEAKEAERLCAKALRREPDNASGHALMGRILIEQLRLDEAEDHWEQANELAPNSASFKLEKSLSLSAVGEFDAAVRELEGSIKAKPVQGAAYQALAYSKRISTEDLPLVEQMEALLASDSLTENEQLSIYYALGKSFDNLGDYQKAFRYFDQANLLKFRLRGSRPFDKAAFVAFIDSHIQLFTKEFFAKHEHVGVSSSLPIMVLGMMRSGTTLVEQMLSCHPSIGGAGEQHFWGDHEPLMIDFKSSMVFGSRVRKYADEFVDLLTSIAPGVPHVIDKNPANLQVVGSLHLAFPNVRIIHTRRDALDTAISIWTTPMSTNAPFINNRESIVFAYKEYLRLMEHWRQVIPANRFLEVNYEELASQPDVQMPRIVEFCGLEWNDACLHPERNSKRIKTPSLWQARQPVYKTSTERWRSYEPWLGVFEELRGLS